MDAWLARYRGLWSQALDALGTELHHGRRVAAQPHDDPLDDPEDDPENHEEGQS